MYKRCSDRFSTFRENPSVSDAGTYNCTATHTSARPYLISSTSVAGYTEVTVQRKIFFAKVNLIYLIVFRIGQGFCKVIV